MNASFAANCSIPKIPYCGLDDVEESHVFDDDSLAMKVLIPVATLIIYAFALLSVILLLEAASRFAFPINAFRFHVVTGTL
jgi:hypothetical protein